MAVRTVSQTGNLSNAATFGGSAFSNGDSIVNPAGSGFVLTIDQDATVAGFSGTGGNGQTLVNSGVTLTLTGNVVQGNKTFTLGSGTGNANLVGDTTGGDIKFLFGNAANFTNYANCKLVCNGTSGAHCSVSKTGSGLFTFDDFSEGAGTGADKAGYDCIYTDFSGITNSDGSFSLAVSSFGNKDHKIDHCTFDSCGTVFKCRTASWGGSANKDYYIRDCRFTNSVGTYCCEVKANGTSGTGAHDVVRNTFDKLVNINAKVTLENNVFLQGTDAAGGPLLSNKGNLYRVVASSHGQLVHESCLDNYWLAGLTHGGNPHMVNGSPADTIQDGWIFEYPLALNIDSGDGIYPPGARTIVRNCLSLPSETDGKFSASIASPNYAFTGQAVVVEHNTVVGINAQMVFDESSATAGNIASLKSNLSCDITGVTSNASIYWDNAQTGNTRHDMSDPAATTNNGGTGLVSFTDPANSHVYTGYRARYTSDPGANDVHANPNFVDPTRNFANWSVYKGTASSGDTLAVRTAASIALVSADPTLVLTDLIPWVRAGFAPTNNAFRGTAHDGADIGAVPMGPAYVLNPRPTVRPVAVNPLFYLGT